METNKRDFIVGCISLALFAITGGYVGYQIGKNKTNKENFELGKLYGEMKAYTELYEEMYSRPKGYRNYYRES